MTRTDTVVEKTCNTCGRIFKTADDFLERTDRWRMCESENLWFNCECGSTLMLKKGKFSWYSPEHALNEEARGVFNTLGNLKDLPHVPTSILELQLLMTDENISPKSLANHLKKEPFVAANVLQVAENLRCTRNPGNARISSLEHAVVYVGRKTLSDIVMTAAIRSFEIPSGDFDSELFWEEGFVTGAVAEALCKRLGLPLNHDEVYLAGSLANVGKLVTAICFPALASKVTRDIKNRKLQSTWRASEHSYRFPEHTILGEIAACMWGLPVFVLEAARHHHNPPRDGAMNLREVVGFAVQMAHWIQLQPHRIEQPLLDAYKEKLGLSEKDVEIMAEELLSMRKLLKTELLLAV